MEGENDNHEALEDFETGGHDEIVMNVMEGYFSDDAASDVGSSTRDIFDEESSDDARWEKSVRKKFSIASHIEVIRESSPICYFCTICQSYFSHKRTARNHEFCGTGEKPFKCKLCDRRFVKKCDRDIHHRVHSGERPFVCSICDKSFQIKHKLSRHMRSHLGIKGGDHQCGVCPRSFISKEALRKHEMNKHNPKKSIQCKSCKKYFERNEQRLKHKCIKPTHRKDFVCEICGKMFSKNWNLTVHLRIHVGHRPFKCEACRKCFRLRQHLERHSAQHQTDADFECMLCKQTFGRKDNMIRHLKLNHPDRHLGIDLKDIVERSERTTASRNSSKVPEGDAEQLRPTVITVNNFPNIRFVKMLPKLGKRDEYRTEEKPLGVDEGVRSVIRSSVVPPNDDDSSRPPRPPGVIVDSASRTSVLSSDCPAPPSTLSDAVERRPVSTHQMPAQVASPRPRSPSYLPVSVLRFKSSSEMKTRVLGTNGTLIKSVQ